MSLENRNPIFLLSQSDIGASKRGAANGPQAVKDEMEKLGYQINDFEVSDHRVFDVGNSGNLYGKHIEAIFSAMQQLNNMVEANIAKNKFPVILSGDHSNAIGGLSGLKNANPDKRIGVIWIDAHADLHSPYTTPSGNLHGMPLAALSGIDNRENARNEVNEEVSNYWNQLKQLGQHKISPKIEMNDLVFIGIRDAEMEEWNVIHSNKILAFDMPAIRQKGMETVLSESLSYLADCDLLYISFDADSLDPSISKGTGTTVPNGLKLEEAQLIFNTLLLQPKLGAFELTEVNPSLDSAGAPMATIIAKLFLNGLHSL